MTIKYTQNLMNSFPIILCIFLPKTHKKYNDAACAEFDSDGNSILLDNKNPFVEPFYKGVYLSLKNNKITEKETLDFFM